METTDVIDWAGDDTRLLLNPRMPADDRARLEALVAGVPPLRAHVWITTSGTSGALKLVALSKDALLASAAAVNEHLGVRSSDSWISVLPTFHVGGLGIFARAYLSGARVIEATWDPNEFARLAESEAGTLSALVPAQVRDIVRAQVRALRAMRAIVVGGGLLDPSLYSEARRLGWPVLPSYGMTECCSQIASALPSDARGDELPDLVLLPHIEVRAEADGRLAISSSALLTAYAFYDHEEQPTFVDPKVDGWFVSEDLGSVDGRVLHVSGRAGEHIKIGGESVDLTRLDRILNDVLLRHELDAAIVSIRDERLGHVIHLAATEEEMAVVDEFNARVLPFERIRAVHRVGAIPRSPLGKLLRSALADELDREGGEPGE